MLPGRSCSPSTPSAAVPGCPYSATNRRPGERTRPPPGSSGAGTVVGAASADVPGTIVGAPVGGRELGPGRPEVAAAAAPGGGGVAQAAARSSTVAVRVAVTAPHGPGHPHVAAGPALGHVVPPRLQSRPATPNSGVCGYFFAAFFAAVVFPLRPRRTAESSSSSSAGR